MVIFRVLMAVSFCLIPFTSLLANSFTASVSHNPIMITDTFTLTLRFEGSRPNEEPDIEALNKDFDVLGVSNDQSIQIINGDYSGTYSWHISLNAKTTGRFTIPTFSLGGFSTQAIQLRVNDVKQVPGQQEKISVQASADKQSAYVGEQVIVTFKLKRRADIQNGGLKVTQQFEYEQLNEANEYYSLENGIRFVNSELKIAVFSDISGPLTIPAIIYNGKVPVKNSRSTFSGFFNNYRTISARSKELLIDIKPKPANTPVNWLPSTAVTVSESWEADKVDFVQGQPVTWTIRLSALGTKHEALPDITMPKVSGLKWYPDQPVGENKVSTKGISATKIFKFAMVPEKSGRIQLPRIEVPWWNTSKDTAALAVLASKTITVQSATPTVTPPNTTPTTSSAPPLSTGIPLANPEPLSSAGIWRPLTFVFAFFWLSTLSFLLFQSNRRKKQTITLEKIADSRKELRWSDLVSACSNNDAQKARAALLSWASLQMNGKQFLSIGALLHYFDDKELKEALINLERALYSKEHAWQGATLLKLLKTNKKLLTHQVKDQSITAALELNPQ